MIVCLFFYRNRRVRWVPQAFGTDGDDEVCFIQLSAEPWHLTLFAHLQVFPQIQHNLNMSENNQIDFFHVFYIFFPPSLLVVLSFFFMIVSPHSSRSPAGRRRSSGWHWCVWDSLCSSSRWRLWGGATAAQWSVLRCDWTTRCSPHPADCRCFLKEGREDCFKMQP